MPGSRRFDRRLHETKRRRRTNHNNDYNDVSARCGARQYIGN